MKQDALVEFVFKPFGAESIDEQLVTNPNPHCNYALRIGDVWIPAEDIYMGTMLLTHWSAYLERIHELYHGSEYEFLQGTSGTVLLMEQAGSGEIRVGDLYDVAAIEDKSQRLGTETFATVSLHTFARATVEQAMAALDQLHTHHQEQLNDDRWVRNIHEWIAVVERDIQQSNGS